MLPEGEDPEPSKATVKGSSPEVGLALITASSDSPEAGETVIVTVALPSSPSLSVTVRLTG